MVSTWTVEDFKANISEDVGSSLISDINLKVLTSVAIHVFNQKDKEKDTLSSARIVMEINGR